ncbi:porin [Polynucleobacter sp. MG-27-Goln-C1]|uniref:porin n=1 Tax=Polynucleobacter sp. MG-27-Goln-C1 TaxID=1819726 RepID=UPI001C0C9225|nr:porin [Polynucleobacter sp. MG-27-Goln-C1]MBU3612656.1 porin [Polynucleobacter sp. MG-27-Goln-C1]
MKKSLFAVAAVTAFAGAAQAQSSVTVYGLLDVGFVGSTSRTTAANVQTKQTGNSFTNSAESTSRLGFKGVEDLGGGMSAFFTVETGLTPAGTNASPFNNRQSFAGLKKNGVGQVAFGTQYTPIHAAGALTDPGQQNNMIGNVFYATNTNGVGNTTQAAGVATGLNQTTDAYTVRTANTLKLESATFAGFNATAIYTLNNQNTTQTASYSTSTGSTAGGNNNNSGWGLGVNYTWQKLLVTANYQSFKSQNPYGTVAATNALPAGTTPSPAIYGTTGGSNVNDNQAYVAATYDFGILKAYAQWVNRKVTSTVNTGYYASRSAQQLGVRSYITPTIEAWASAGNGRIDSFGAGSPTANLVAWQLGSNYYLSKRTNLYAIYGQAQTSNVVVTGTNAGNLSANANNYAVGVRHTF